MLKVHKVLKVIKVLKVLRVLKVLKVHKVVNNLAQIFALHSEAKKSNCGTAQPS